MNILYLGAFPPAFLIKRSGGKIDSFYRASESLIEGFRSLSDVKLDVITSPDLSSWPRGPLFIPREESRDDGVTLVSSLNISFIKQLWTIISMTYECIRCIRKNEGKTVVLIPYVVFRHVFTLRLLRLLCPRRVMQACIVPDIFFPTSKLVKAVNSFTIQMASKFDAFVFYTKHMSDKFHVESDKYEVIEGYRTILERDPVSADLFKVVYAGTLNLEYGVGRLVDAMALLSDPDIELHLYGAGSGVTAIQEASINDPRIVYHGRVSNTEASDAIYGATLLINPRNASDGEYTKYSFPSKDIEYLSTGIPTLLCKLPGMPPEYYGFFIDLGDATPSEIASAITKVKTMSTEERNMFGKKARAFIKDRMNCTRQAERIRSLFERVLS